jgi:hypothetical protein
MLFCLSLQINFSNQIYYKEFELPNCPIRILDEQSGVSKSSKTKSPLLDITGGSYNNHKGNTDKITERGHNDKGGASRFFYTAKS